MLPSWRLISSVSTTSKARLVCRVTRTRALVGPDEHIAQQLDAIQLGDGQRVSELNELTELSQQDGMGY